MLVLAGIVVATLTTGVVHYTLGGMMFLLNAAGYVTLAVLVIAPVPFLQRVRPLVLIALALFTITTIVGWVIMGGRIPLAYFTKAVELVLLGLIAVYLAWHRAEIVPAARYLLKLAQRMLGRSTDEPLTPATSNDEK